MKLLPAGVGWREAWDVLVGIVCIGRSLMESIRNHDDAALVFLGFGLVFLELASLESRSLRRRR